MKVAVISTGDELTNPGEPLEEGRVYDCNTTMLKLLVEKFNFKVHFKTIAKDDKESLKNAMKEAIEKCDVIISSGGVSMGDKDFVKPLLMELDFEIVFGRVNMKPGKPMTFAHHNGLNKAFFALPGNTVSAFVCFHIFVLPALRYMSGFPESRCKLPQISTILAVDKYVLDDRPEFARAMVAYKNSNYYSYITGDQVSNEINFGFPFENPQSNPKKEKLYSSQVNFFLIL